MSRIKWIVCGLAVVLALCLVGVAAQAIPPQDPEPNEVCYTATVILDYDCDGRGNVGWNEEAESLNSCYNTLAAMEAEAPSKSECWWTPEPNCIEYEGACKSINY